MNQNKFKDRFALVVELSMISYAPDDLCVLVHPADFIQEKKIFSVVEDRGDRVCVVEFPDCETRLQYYKCDLKPFIYPQEQ